MHPLGDKNKYVGMMFMKMSKEYWALGREGIRKISAAHAKDLMPYSSMLTHVVCGGFDARYDQVTMIEADSLEQIHEASTAFRIGAKGQYISVVDVVVGVKAPPRGNRAPARRRSS
ncbi:MAG: hypothetical protein ACREH6_15640 [Geminicoccaceae bacterium]